MKKNYRKPRIKFIELGMEAALLAASETIPAAPQNTLNGGISGNGASNNSTNNRTGWLAPTAHGIIDDYDTENE